MAVLVEGAAAAPATGSMGRLGGASGAAGEVTPRSETEGGMAGNQVGPSASALERAFRYNRLGLHFFLAGAKVATGQTPKAVIWTRNKATLYRYVPPAQIRFPVPVLLVYALIDRPFILDLIPGNSFAEYLVQQGFDVYLLDWGIPGGEDRALLFDDYVLDYLAQAVPQVGRASRAEAVTLFGACIGGLLAAMYAALFPGPHLRNLILYATPIDCSPEHLGPFRWITVPGVRPELLVALFGNVPPEFLGSTPRPLKAITGYLGTFLGLGDRLSQDRSLATWIALNQWVSEGIPFAGEAFRQMIHDLVQHNMLVKGEFRLRGRPVDLKNITCSLLSIAGTQDFICRVQQAEAIMGLAGSQDKEFCVLESGHIGMMAGAEARQGLWLEVHRWLEARSR
jgi:polyhydroxyalkanoate synthase subunit PhaC